MFWDTSLHVRNLIQEVYLLADIPHLTFPLFLLHLFCLLFVLYFSIVLFFLPSSICDSTSHQNKPWEDFNFRRVNLLSVTGRMSWAPAGISILVWNVVGFFIVLKFQDAGRWGLWWGWQWDVPRLLPPQMPPLCSPLPAHPCRTDPHTSFRPRWGLIRGFPVCPIEENNTLFIPQLSLFLFPRFAFLHRTYQSALL